MGRILRIRPVGRGEISHPTSPVEAYHPKRMERGQARVDGCWFRQRRIISHSVIYMRWCVHVFACVSLCACAHVCVCLFVCAQYNNHEAFISSPVPLMLGVLCSTTGILIIYIWLLSVVIIVYNHYYNPHNNHFLLWSLSLSLLQLLLPLVKSLNVTAGDKVWNEHQTWIINERIGKDPDTVYISKKTSSPLS